MCVHNDASNMVSSCIKAEVPMLRKQNENYPFLKKGGKRNFLLFFLSEGRIVVRIRKYVDVYQNLDSKAAIAYYMPAALPYLCGKTW